ncbi:MAG: hypothetical protein V1820_00755 [archaeon]
MAASSELKRIEEMGKRLLAIEQRNRKVELDKAWETSGERKLALFILTYLAAGFFFQSIGISKPWLNAIVPASAFVLSTLTLSVLKGKYSAARNNGLKRRQTSGTLRKRKNY